MRHDPRNHDYPLGIQCGQNAWQQLSLTAELNKTPAPERPYLLQLVADRLRHDAPQQALSAAELGLWATLNQVLHRLGSRYLEQRRCRLFRQRLQIGEQSLERPLLPLLENFLRLFPIAPLCRDQLPLQELLARREAAGELEGLLLELFLLRIQRQNRALSSALELFAAEESQLQQSCNYHQQLEQLAADLSVASGFEGADSLLELFRQPLAAAPGSLRGQLNFLRQTWGGWLPDELLLQIDSAFDLLASEEQQRGPLGEAPAAVFDPGRDAELANFTADHDWMPRTVLLAKSIHVWLDQLSRKYRCQIERLDQIPDQELDQLAEQGFSCLWLIGIWQRSAASQRIKHLSGQQDVSGSAYAIHDYHIAADLGGEAALDQLRQRCRQRGLDLACDVVTNHTGIDSTWVEKHPDWFIQVDHPPYPGYRFDGADLSDNPAFSVQIENGYFDHSEAAVVFRHQNHQDGRVRYIYHGNDGTHLPWNDTAQLNFLLPEVREEMIRTVIEVARHFRVIRFDAAMTLAKKHFQRLWFPLPGGGAGVPSRAAHWLSREEFERHFPVEFWRELVDRVQAEVPDTLLIAEAFWLMEGYFVRTLGMHRVYNSAFMNMLKREENGKYRQTIKNILAFDPAILQRFVNFMSNPDEKTAIEQFGRDEKYFCVATLLATMPGLPMFAHGQIDGLREKYGMEFRQARWQEEVDQELVERHRQRIFPLLRNRSLFSGAEQFQLYDFFAGGQIEENVFAYSNRRDKQAVLILCNNSPHRISGRLGPSVPHSGQPAREAGKILNFHGGPEQFYRFVDLTSGREYLRPAAHLQQSSEFTLTPYAHHVFSNFQRFDDQDRSWRQLWEQLGESGCDNLDDERCSLLLQPVLQELAQLLEQPALLMETTPQRLSGRLDHPALNGLPESRLLRLALNSAGSGTASLAPEGVEKLLNWYLESLSQPLKLISVFKQLFRDTDLRNFLQCHLHNDVEWFNREAIEVLTQGLLCLHLCHSHLFNENNISKFSMKNEQEIMSLARLLSTAEKTNYQMDEFLQEMGLAGPLDHPFPNLADASGGSRSMKILFVTPEAIPFAKTGGLADVAGSLPRALRQLGHDVRVIMPCHRSAERNGVTLRKGRKSIEVPLAGKQYRANLKQATYEGVPFWFVDTPEFFDRDGLYGTADGDYPDNALRFGFFCRAVLEFLRRIDFRPDILHLHDWQASLIPALLRSELAGNPFFSPIASLLTIHNLGYQGQFPMETLKQLDLPAELGRSEALEYFGRISTLKGGIVFSDLINTVSPSYCREIQGQVLGHGFDGILRQRSEDLFGIVNGLDLKLWDPALDPALAKPFSAANLNGKRSCKRQLQKELGLEMRHDVPLVAVISRLDKQKGIDLIERIWPHLLERDLQFVLLGTGDQAAMEFWRRQQGQQPGRTAILLKFDEALSRRIYAASDLFLVPSRYEPCGLTQMIALHYGALPVVRRTGGLADTIIDLEESPRQGCGFVFDQAEPEPLLAALDRGLALYPQRSRWLNLVKRGMQQDFSWARSAEQYQELYRKAIAHRLAAINTA